MLHRRSDPLVVPREERIASAVKCETINSFPTSVLSGQFPASESIPQQHQQEQQHLQMLQQQQRQQEYQLQMLQQQQQQQQQQPCCSSSATDANWFAGISTQNLDIMLNNLDRYPNFSPISDVDENGNMLVQYKINSDSIEFNDFDFDFMDIENEDYDTLGSSFFEHNGGETQTSDNESIT